MFPLKILSFNCFFLFEKHLLLCLIMQVVGPGLNSKVRMQRKGSAADPAKLFSRHRTSWSWSCWRHLNHLNHSTSHTLPLNSSSFPRSRTSPFSPQMLSVHWAPLPLSSPSWPNADLRSRDLQSAMNIRRRCEQLRRREIKPNWLTAVEYSLCCAVFLSHDCADDRPSPTHLETQRTLL